MHKPHISETQIQMKILVVHNYYQQPGGEDAVFQNERALLEQHGHQVRSYVRHNNEISGQSIFQKLRLSTNTLWNPKTARDLKELIREFKPDVAHFTNTFPLVSPAAYYVCHQNHVPVIQTVQNYRLICPRAVLMRDGQTCEKCVGAFFPWAAIAHRCYHESALQSAVVATMLFTHRMIGTWSREVNIYVAATEFSRTKLKDGGIPAEKIWVKPNFLSSDPGERNSGTEGEYVLFVGRIAQEKGVWTLVSAWKDLDHMPLYIAGDGPLLPKIRQYIQQNQMSHVHILGHQTNTEILVLMKRARFLVFPSEWYEGFPMTITEAFACGLPVVASRLGAMAEIIDESRTGLHFDPGDPQDLAAKVEWAWSHPEAMQAMGQEARKEYEEKYTAERNYKMLMDIYHHAVASYA